MDGKRVRKKYKAEKYLLYSNKHGINAKRERKTEVMKKTKKNEREG